MKLTISELKLEDVKLLPSYMTDLDPIYSSPLFINIYRGKCDGKEVKVQVPYPLHVDGISVEVEKDILSFLGYVKVGKELYGIRWIKEIEKELLIKR